MAARGAHPRPDAARRRPRLRLRRALRDSRGSATLEFALWLPVLIGLLMGVADLALIFTTNANMQHAARETARGLARHAITELEAPGYLRERLNIGTLSDYAVKVVNGPDVEVSVTISADAASVFGFYETILPGDIVAHVVMRREDPV
jgi:Flp pilus assembly protein TadG